VSPQVGFSVAIRITSERVRALRPGASTSGAPHVHDATGDDVGHHKGRDAGPAAGVPPMAQFREPSTLVIIQTQSLQGALSGRGSLAERGDPSVANRLDPFLSVAHKGSLPHTASVTKIHAAKKINSK
jgi:hypothetical protein